MKAVGHQPVDSERIQPMHVFLHSVESEIVRIAAETFALHPVLAVLFRRRRNQLASEIQRFEGTSVGDIRRNVVEARNSDIFLKGENIHAVCRRKRVFLTDAVTAEFEPVRFTPVVDRLEETLDEKLLNGSPVCLPYFSRIG